MTYWFFLIITILISFVFSIGTIQVLYLKAFAIACVPIILTTIYGLLKFKKSQDRYLIIFSSLYYIITLFCTVHQTITSFYILIPLTLIPIITSKIVKHVGLGNRIAISFWFVLIAAMLSKQFPLIRPYALSFAVLLSFFLESLTIHTNEIETFSANAPVWHNGRPTFPIFNPERFEREKKDD